MVLLGLHTSKSSEGNQLNDIKIWMICVLIRGDMRPALWGADVGNSWRTTDDISDSWERSGLCIYL